MFLRLIWNELASKEFETAEVEFRKRFIRVLIIVIELALSIVTLYYLISGEYEIIGIVFAGVSFGLLLFYLIGAIRYRNLLST